MAGDAYWLTDLWKLGTRELSIVKSGLASDSVFEQPRDLVCDIDPFRETVFHMPVRRKTCKSTFVDMPLADVCGQSQIPL
jgi:hypothetical protein